MEVTVRSPSQEKNQRVGLLNEGSSQVRILDWIARVPEGCNKKNHKGSLLNFREQSGSVPT